MKTEIEATYGSAQKPSTVFIEERGTLTYYAVEGSCNVNCTYETLEDLVDVEEVEDVDTFRWPNGVDSYEELIEAIEA